MEVKIRLHQSMTLQLIGEPNTNVPIRKNRGFLHGIDPPVEKNIHSHRFPTFLQPRFVPLRQTVRADCCRPPKMQVCKQILHKFCARNIQNISGAMKADSLVRVFVRKAGNGDDGPPLLVALINRKNKKRRLGNETFVEMTMRLALLSFLFSRELQETRLPSTIFSIISRTYHIRKKAML
ncbi:unnamed protein product [Nesidiocoris tenuis]|uniref:Uncharacterized protein n=1 Tax=Nesidiocoris tenuis TaxID=355587 RepID=A0A6H5GW13_9HEMI|nr:unnamed protein product [Nesidiocoris tenuis]